MPTVGYQDGLRRIYVLTVICVMAVLVSGGLSCRNVFATDYYVDASVSYDNDNVPDGSDSLPWNTLAQVNAAMSTFGPGDHIKLKRGTTFYNESLLISDLHGGIEEADRIVFEAYDDPNDPSAPLPVIDGTKAVTWTLVGNDIYSAASSNKPNVVLYKGTPKPSTTTLRLNTVPLKLAANAILLQIDPYANFWVRSTNGNTVSGITWMGFIAGKQVTYRYVENGKEERSSDILTIEEVISTAPAADVGLTEWGDWYYDAGNIYLLAEEDPNTNTVQVPNAADKEDGIRWPDGIRVISSSHVQVQDIKVQKFQRNGVIPGYSSYITVQGVHVYGCGGSGIKLYNTSYNTIQNNTIDSNAAGITLYTVPVEGNKTIDNQVLTNTIINSRGTGIALVRDKPGVDGGDVSGNNISGNIITNSTTMTYDNAGVYTFYAGSNTIQSNVIRNGGSKYLRSAGIQIDMAIAPMTISGNTIENNSLGGVAASGAGHIITNNTLLNNGAALAGRAQVGFFYAGTPASNCTVTGNTMQVDQGYHFIVADTLSCSGHTINNNTYRYRGGASEYFYWPCSSWQWMDFETWQSQTGHDKDSTLSQLSNIFMFLNGWIHSNR